ncbi:MAG: ThuA domain-containing protein [Planctomycetes bacterium]|nr:ThuA domain-containing protein [Planctomycetota bacterium]
MLTLLATATLLLGGAQEPLRVFLRGGPKTHGPGEHEHALFVDEWTRLLRERGAEVDGALTFPSAAQLAQTDVLVIYAAEGASIHGAEREHFDAFRARGGGLVVLHDGVCGDDPEWFASVAGGAWRHGRARYKEGPTDVHVTDKEHPITRGIASWRFDDEIYWDLEIDPAARILARGFHTVFDATPQAWVLEQGPARSFVSIQGHEWTSFAHPAWRALVLRGIAWAGRRDDVDLLVSQEERAQLAYPPGGPTAPERAHGSIMVHPDFGLSLVAAEPLIEKPISIDWDARGRTWVALTPGYPDKSQFSGVPPHDEIVVLEDADGDGRMDSRRTFCGGLDLVTSFVFHRDGVIVSASPDIFFIRDTDGDGTGETRETLFTGFGYGDTHAVVSNLRWGIDGWIYATQGYSGGASRHVKNAAGRDFGHIGNGIFRFKPDGSAIEMVSSYGSNTWGLDFDDAGELFFTMANGAHLRHVVVPERVLADARVGQVESWTDLPDHDRVVRLSSETIQAYVQIDFVGGFTAASGCTIYTGGAWPAEWNGTHFVSEPTVNLVHHDVVTPKGVTFTATKAREAEFLASTDRWFRPVHARVGPDGALYVLDFYNQAVVHNDTRGPKHGPTNAAERPDRDRTHGRIWRVQHGSARPLHAQGLAHAPASGLARALAHENRWQRLSAQRLLVERGGAAELEGLRSALASPSPQARIHALWALAELGALAPPELAIALASDDARVRRNATRIAGASSPAREDVLVQARLVTLATTDDSRSRLEALVTLGECDPTPAIADAVVRAWPILEDAWSQSAAVRVALRQGSALWRALEHAGSAAPADLVAQVVRRAARSAGHEQFEALLAFLAAGAEHDPGATRAALEALDDSPADTIAVAAGGTQALARLLSSPDLGVAMAAMSVAARLVPAARPTREVEVLSARLHALLADSSGEHASRVAALRALITVPEHRPAAIVAAAPLLAPSVALPTQLGVVDVLGKLEDVAAARVLCQAISGSSSTVQARIFEKLVARASWSHILLDAIESAQIEVGALGPQRTHRLRTHSDSAIAQRALALLGAATASGAAIDELVARLLPEVDRPGDAEHGRVVFAANCASCHVANGVGGKIGPDVTGMGAHGARELLPIILDPNRAVETGYSEWIAETRDGEIVSGILARETDRSILLRSATGDVELERAEIEALKNTGRSLMPAGFEALGATALRDVIAYLSMGTEGYRVLDLAPVASANSSIGLYDVKRDANPMRFRRFGIQDVVGVPFEILDPARTASGSNVLVLKGGLRADWDSKTKMPQRVEVEVGALVERVHVLGGIAAWGFPYFKDLEPIVKWTWVYADGRREEVVLKNGVEFGDWIARHDVPGSEYVEELLAEDSWGQVRYHALVPARREQVTSIVLESYDNRYAPTIVALTAELPGAPKRAAAPEPSERQTAKVVLVGGGSSHEFGRWFDREDRAILAAVIGDDVLYTGRTADLALRLSGAQVLVLSTNQPIAEPDARAIVEFVEKGGGLLLLHPATWRNWPDWKEHAELCGGGSSSHEAFAAFDVTVLEPRHALCVSVPATFRIEDELYRFEPAPDARGVTTLARGRSLSSGAEYPVLWTLARGRGKVVGFTLGHDGRAHEHGAFRAILQNSVRYLMQP